MRASSKSPLSCLVPWQLFAHYCQLQWAAKGTSHSAATWPWGGLWSGLWHRPHLRVAYREIKIKKILTHDLSSPWICSLWAVRPPQAPGWCCVPSPWFRLARYVSQVFQCPSLCFSFFVRFVPVILYCPWGSKMECFCLYLILWILLDLRWWPHLFDFSCCSWKA